MRFPVPFGTFFGTFFGAFFGEQLFASKSDKFAQNPFGKRNPLIRKAASPLCSSPPSLQTSSMSRVSASIQFLQYLLGLTWQVLSHSPCRKVVTRSWPSKPCSFWFPCFLRFASFLAFLCVFPFLSKDFRDSAERENPCFFRGFPCFFSKKARVGGSGKILSLLMVGFLD